MRLHLAEQVATNDSSSIAADATFLQRGGHRRVRDDAYHSFTGDASGQIQLHPGVQNHTQSTYACAHALHAESVRAGAHYHSSLNVTTSRCSLDSKNKATALC